MFGARGFLERDVNPKPAQTRRANQDELGRLGVARGRQIK